MKSECFFMQFLYRTLTATPVYRGLTCLNTRAKIFYPSIFFLFLYNYPSKGRYVCIYLSVYLSFFFTCFRIMMIVLSILCYWYNHQGPVVSFIPYHPPSSPPLHPSPSPPLPLSTPPYLPPQPPPLQLTNPNPCSYIKFFEVFVSAGFFGRASSPCSGPRVFCRGARNRPLTISRTAQASATHTRTKIWLIKDLKVDLSDR